MLITSISIEAAELLEYFQWNAAEPDMQHVREELADVLTYCLHLARRIGADPEQVFPDKLELTRKKYPVEKAKGGGAKDERKMERISVRKLKTGMAW